MTPDFTPTTSLNYLDYTVCIVFFVLMALIGVVSAVRAGKNSSEYFLSGRNMPWWLLGFSLVATTFAADTPNFVANVIRTQGVAGNWCWWAFLLTGMVTVFIYAKLWHRLGVLTDIEFYEKRYSGKSAAVVRGFRTLYLGLIFNTVVMANVTLAMIKILGVSLGMDPIVTIVSAGLITVIFSVLGGFTAVIWADFIMFLVAMFGAIALAVVAVQLPKVGGLSNMLAHPNVSWRLSMLPELSQTDLVVTLLVIPLAIQWWSAWYPGAEPGGGSYVAQRMLAAKSENHALGATLFFNFCHYAVRPFPWIVVALASLIVFPDIASLREAFPNIPAHMMKDDLAYPAMFQFLPHGLFGLMITSLFAAYMSTIATHLNLGSSYMVNDFYQRFIRPDASEKKLVLMGRIWTVILMVLASVMALYLESAMDTFQIILSIGAGTGLLFLLRWFWWRINAYSEIAAMAISFIVAMTLRFWPALDWMNDSERLVWGVAITTVGWLIVTFLTPADDDETLFAFVRRTGASGPGWRKVYERAAAKGIDLRSEAEPVNVPLGLLCSILGCSAIFSSLFAVGKWVYLQYMPAMVLTGISLVSWLILWHFTKKLMETKKEQAAEE
ncbi:MAG: Na+:solute symporter [Thermoguttaceae bacterium]|nr:Na+:solute symporter [Thermoguttaceae bacterium]